MAGYKTNDRFYSGKCDTISSFDSHFTRYHIKCYNVMEAWKPTCKCTNMPETNLLELYSSIMNFIQSEINEECEICWSGISSAHLEHCLFWHGLIMQLYLYRIVDMAVAYVLLLARQLASQSFAWHPVTGKSLFMFGVLSTTRSHCCLINCFVFMNLVFRW